MKQQSRRDFLKPLPPDTEPSDRTTPVGGGTVRVATRAMACEFCVVMNPGNPHHIDAVGDVLELIHDIESWLSIYRADSELSRVNRLAAQQPVVVRRPLFELLQQSVALHEATDGAFDIAAGAQIQLWRRCRAERRLPTDAEIAQALQASGSQHIELNEEETSVRLTRAGVQLDPGAIGKGYALDESAEWLSRLPDGPSSFLIHGGHSSLIARGDHNQQGGWPVGIGNPLLTKKRLGTVLLRDCAMSTSGSNIQFYRHQGRRLGHILDPRTGWPVEGMLSVTVFADSAAVADALSTAFFVLGVENAVKCCDNLDGVGAILVPYPEKGKRVKPVLVGVSPDIVFWDEEQVAL